MVNILNQETMDSLRELGDDFFRELIETFIESSQTQMDSLHQALTEENGSGIDAAAHSLKGACYGQGAEELGELCKQMEAKGRENDLTDITPLMR
jgi:histidine phosphotransfer protein HptB